MNIAIVVILTLAGVLLLVAELFLIPGVGIAGLLGVGALAGAVAWAYVTISSLAGHVTLGAAVLLTIVSIIVFVRSRAFDKMALDTQIDSKVTLADPGKKITKLEQAAAEMDN